MALVRTRDVPKLAIRAEFDLSTINVEARTVRLMWTTGARVLRGFYEPYWEELSLDPKHVRMGRLQSGAAPLLNAHRSRSISDVIGVVEEATITKTGGEALVRFDSGVEGEEVFRKVREKIVRNVSVGYATYKMQKIEDGATTTPVYRAVDWEPHEISMVPIGADAGAVTRGQGEAFPCEFITEEKRAMDDETQTTAPATPAPAPQPVAAVRSSDDSAIAAERERVGAIHRAARELGRPTAEAEAAVEAGTSFAAFFRAAADARAAAPPEQGGLIQFGRNPSITAGDDSRDKWMRGLTTELLFRAGVADRVVKAGKRMGIIDLDDERPREFRGMRMGDIARICIQRGGQSFDGLSQLEMLGRALTMRGAASTSDFPVLLENTTNKALLAGYELAPILWNQLARTGSVADFKASNRYKKGSFGVLSIVNEGGEFARKSIPDGEKERISAVTKGDIIAITRKALIDDDLGAFVGLAADLGESVALTIDTDLFALLALNSGLGPTMADGVTLFHASHANIGTGSALTVAGLDADRVLMGSQKDPSKNRTLNLRPSTLLVSLALGGQARILNQSQYDPDATNKLQLPNKVAGLFSQVIDAAYYTGPRRYLFSAQAPTFEVVFLDGVQAPYLESREGWSVDGTETKVRIDYGVGAIDWRAAVTNAGA